MRQERGRLAVPVMATTEVERRYLPGMPRIPQEQEEERQVKKIEEIRAWIAVCEKARVEVPEQIYLLDAYAVLLEARVSQLLSDRSPCPSCASMGERIAGLEKALGFCEGNIDNALACGIIDKCCRASMEQALKDTRAALTPSPGAGKVKSCGPENPCGGKDCPSDPIPSPGAEAKEAGYDPNCQDCDRFITGPVPCGNHPDPAVKAEKKP